jgi:hypothetical protein
MTKTSKSLLIISIICLIAGLAFVTGLINVRNAVVFYVTLPTGAVLFGLFLISQMLEKEVALYDEAQQKVLTAISRRSADSSPALQRIPSSSSHAH